MMEYLFSIIFINYFNLDSFFAGRGGGGGVGALTSCIKNEERILEKKGHLTNSAPLIVTPEAP